MKDSCLRRNDTNSVAECFPFHYSELYGWIPDQVRDDTTPNPRAQKILKRVQDDRYSVGAGFIRPYG
jgi:hypothetical protein